MLSIKKIKNINLYNLFILVFLISSCSSMNVTEEVVYDGGIRTVEASMQEDAELDYETKAIFTNATVYFQFDKFNLNSKIHMDFFFKNKKFSLSQNEYFYQYENFTFCYFIFYKNILLTFTKIFYKFIWM